MSSDNIAIRVDCLSKCYQIYERPQDRLKQSTLPKLHSLIGRAPKSYYREFWALNEVSFDVARGETVGIIGRNGSGKSTVLQMICGTLEPTTGTVETQGRVAALLELGAGFNPEFTGRENVHMNATVLGLSQAEIDDRFADIAAFADIGDFIEQPVKHYSSGMYARLAFAVAISVDPNILIVDEALAVGDEAFQRKCFARMEQIKANGATILLVAHSGALITQLCDRAILLNKGNNIYVGKPKLAVAWYQRLVAAPEEAAAKIIEEMRAEQASNALQSGTATADTDQAFAAAFGGIASPLSDVSTTRVIESDVQLTPKFDEHLKPLSTIIYATNGAEICDARIETLEGENVNILVPRERYQIRYKVKFEREARLVNCHFGIRSVAGVTVGGGMAPHRNESFPAIDAHTELDIMFRFDCNLIPGTYFLNCGVVAGGEVLHRQMDIIMFRVQDSGSNYSIGFLDFHIEAISSRSES